MSFIYDHTNLINHLIKLAQSVAAPGNQGDAGGNAARAAIALKLLDKIESAAAPDEPIISSEKDTPTDLFDLNLEGIGALIKYLAEEKIMVNYHRIVYDNQESPPDKTYKPYKLEGNAFFLGEMDTEGKLDPTLKYDFFINKDLLVNYLMSLQQDADKKNIPVMKVKLGALINEANRQFGTKLDPNYKPPAKPGEQPVKPGEQPSKPGEQPGGQPSGGTQSIQSLVLLLPLQRERIDFTRIRRFFTALTNFMGSYSGPHSAEIRNNMNNAMSKMQSTANMTGNKDTIFSMGASWEDVRRMLMTDAGTPVGYSYIPFLENLQSIVLSTAAVVENFYVMYAGEDDERAKDKFTEDQIAKIKDQIIGPGCIKNKNLQRLQELERDVDKVGVPK